MSAVKNREKGLISIKEYLDFEAFSGEKHEFRDGEIVAMSGGSIPHGIISGNAFSAIGNAVEREGKDCIALNNDIKIFIESANHFVYADAMVICGEIETFQGDDQAVVNPLLIVEVLSDSTAGYDRGDKFHKYCSLSSFKEYVLIDQTQPVVDILFREDKNYWRMTTTIGLDKSIELHSIGCEISMSELYKRIKNLNPPQFTLEF